MKGEQIKLKILGKFLKGSQNYNLQTPESDEDFIVVYCNSYRELYDGAAAPSNTEHECYWSLQFFVKRLKEMDPTALEIIFSTKAFYYDSDFKAIVSYVCAILKAGKWVPHNWSSFVNKHIGLCTSDFKNAFTHTDWPEKRRLKALSRAIYMLGLAGAIVDNSGKVDESLYRDMRLSYWNEAYSIKTGQDNEAFDRWNNWQDMMQIVKHKLDKIASVKQSEPFVEYDFVNTKCYEMAIKYIF